MPAESTRLEQLEAQNAELRVRLQEAEEALQAVRTGEVDALVVSGPGGGQPFTLRGAEEPYQQLIEEMNQGAVTLDRDGTILYTNRKFAESLKVSSDCLIGNKLENYILEHDRPAFAHLLESTQASRGMGEVMIQAGDGTQIAVQLSLSALPLHSVARWCVVTTDVTDPKGRELALLNMMEDAIASKRTLESVNRGLQQEIAERKRAEESLRQIQAELEMRVQQRTLELSNRVAELAQAETALRLSEEKFRLQIESMPIGCILQDKQLRLQTWNPAAGAMFGLSPAQSLGKQTWETVSSWDNGVGFQQELRKVLSNSQCKASVHNHVSASGQKITCEWHSIRIEDAAGEVCGVLSTVVDITERRSKEQQIERLNQELRIRLAQLQAANQELDGFASSVSHDLRAPLRHIAGYSSRLEKLAREMLPEKGKHYLDEISQSAKQMGQLIDDLLTFARMGRVELRQEKLDLAELAQQTVEQLQPEMRGRQIVFRQGNLPRVRADQALIRQVFVNLLSNAVKFTRHREQAEIEIGCAPANPWEVAIYVRDNGVGFDMAYANKLFGVFQRLHSEDEFEGTGIGLANVRRIIARHGGRTWAEGMLNKGACFYFTLPRSPEEMPS